MTWDASLPDDDVLVTTGQAGIRANWVALNTTITVDHNGMDATRDGEHKQVTMYKSDSKPSSSGKANTGFLYTKDDGSTAIELFYEDDSANEVQITDSGRVKGDIIAALNFDNTAAAGTYTAGVDSEIRYSYNVTSVEKTATTVKINFSQDLPENYLPIAQQSNAANVSYTATAVDSITFIVEAGTTATYFMAIMYDA